ncbi:MAG: enoyl-CoA hydratase/isomerase family protein [Sphingopyxis sp.]|nr:enoyl-CoA hydratase/isomerase family protein [Sphingopyxis sp.]
MNENDEQALSSRYGPVSLISFQPPADGTISTAGGAAIGAVLARELGDTDVRAIVLTGAREGVFIRHGNLAEIGHAAAALSSGAVAEEDFLGSPFAVLCAALDGANKPVVAAINGDCMGGGFEIALACTMRIAAVSAKAIGLPEIRIDIPPGVGGPQRLARLIGWHRARLFALQGTVLAADDAHAMGLVDDVADDAVAAALDMAQIFATRSPPVVSEIMRQMRPTDDDHIRNSILGFARRLAMEGTSDVFARLAAGNVALEQLD